MTQDSTISPGINADDLVQVVLLSVVFIALALFFLFKLKTSFNSLVGDKNVPKAASPSSGQPQVVRRKAD
jgi:hypothetical protein